MADPVAKPAPLTLDTANHATVAAAIAGSHVSTQFDPAKLNQYFSAVDALLVSLHKAGITLPASAQPIIDKVSSALSTMDVVVDDVEPFVSPFNSDASNYQALADDLAALAKQVDALQSAQNGIAPAGGSGA